MSLALLHQAFELNTLIWKKGPFVRFPFQWNPEKCKQETEKNPKRHLIWLCSSTVPFAILFADLIFLATVGLKAPHIDNLKNWILTFELLPLVTYIFIYNLKMYCSGFSMFADYQNSLVQLLLENATTPQIRNMNRGRTRPVEFVGNLLKGNHEIQKMGFRE